jgi:membrane-anchored mycosin MYCP
VAAPGTGAVSLSSTGPNLISELVDADGQARPLDGTSFATPYVAGLVALVRERFSHLSARQVMRRIEQTAQHTAGPGGRSEELGYGMVDPVSALTAVLPEEQSPDPAAVGPARLSDLGPSPVDSTLPRTVALAGSAAALTLLGLTFLITRTIRRHNRIRRAQRG